MKFALRMVLNFASVAGLAVFAVVFADGLSSGNKLATGLGAVGMLLSIGGLAYLELSRSKAY